MRLGNDRAAARLRSEFRVSDRRFWGIKVSVSHTAHHNQYRECGSLHDIPFKERLRAEFRVNDRRFWGMKVRVLEGGGTP